MMHEILEAGIHWRILNFLIFLGILFFALRKPSRDFWNSRSDGIRQNLEEATRLKRDALEKNQQLQARFLKIEKEMQSLVKSLEDDAALEKKHITEDMEKLSARIRQDTERIAAQEVQKARATLKSQVVHHAMELAKKFVTENFKDSDQKKISEEYLTSLQKEPA